MNDKITTIHLSRGACVYIRQSTTSQVMNNVESQHVQYNLSERAAQLGWPPSQIKIIDQDLGCSAAGATDRLGFEQLLQDICSSNIGAIFSVDASRLARNGREWHTLLELCSKTKGHTSSLLSQVMGVLVFQCAKKYSGKGSNQQRLVELMEKQVKFDEERNKEISGIAESIKSKQSNNG